MSGIGGIGRVRHQERDAHAGTADANEGTDRPHGPTVANCPPTPTLARHHRIHPATPPELQTPTQPTARPATSFATNNIHPGRFHTDPERTRSHAAATFSASIGARKNAPQSNDHRVNCSKHNTPVGSAPSTCARALDQAHRSADPTSFARTGFSSTYRKNDLNPKSLNNCASNRGDQFVGPARK